MSPSHLPGPPGANAPARQAVSPSHLPGPPSTLPVTGTQARAPAMCVARPPHLPGPDSALPVDTGLRTRQARSNAVTEAPAMCVARPLHLPGPNTALPGTTGLRTRQARSSTVIGTARRNHAPLPHVTRWLWLQVQTRALHGSTVTGITGIWLLERTLPVTTGLTVQILTFLDTRDTHLPFFTGIAGVFPLTIAYRLQTRSTGSTGIAGM